MQIININNNYYTHNSNRGKEKEKTTTQGAGINKSTQSILRLQRDSDFLFRFFKYLKLRNIFTNSQRNILKDGLHFYIYMYEYDTLIGLITLSPLQQ